MKESCSNEADQNCLLCQRPQKKLLEDKLQTTEGKFPVPKMFHAWTYHFSNIQEFSFVPHLFRCHYLTVAKAFCHLRNEIVVFQTKLTPVDCLMNSNSIIFEMEIM